MTSGAGLAPGTHPLGPSPHYRKDQAQLRVSSGLRPQNTQAVGQRKPVGTAGGQGRKQVLGLSGAQTAELPPALQAKGVTAQASSGCSQAGLNSGFMATGPNILMLNSLSASHPSPSPCLSSSSPFKQMDCKWDGTFSCAPTFFASPVPGVDFSFLIQQSLSPSPLEGGSSPSPYQRPARGQASCCTRALLSRALILMVFPQST